MPAGWPGGVTSSWWWWRRAAFRTDAAGRGTGTATTRWGLFGRQPLYVESDSVTGVGHVFVTDKWQFPIPRHPFVDVPAGAYYDDAVSWMRHTGVTTGCTDDRYCPGDPVTRAQVATFVHRLSAESPWSREMPFRDVDPDAYYSEAVHWMADTGLTTGVGGSDRFEPHRAITRAELVTILHRVSTDPTRHPRTMRDVPAGSYFDPAVAWASAHGVTTGVGGSDRFEPNRVVTRAEAAAFVHRFVTSSASSLADVWLRV